MNIEIVIASLAVVGTWVIYRINNLKERERILMSLRALLDVAQWWIGTSYSENFEKAEWYDPGKSVYKIDTSIIPNIISSNLIEKELSIQLTYFVQLIGRFNQRVDMYCQYIYSDINLFLDANSFVNESLVDSYKNYLSYNDCLRKVEELKNREEDLLLYNYLNKVYKHQKILHTDGIGDESYYTDKNTGSKFPKLHKCFSELNYALKQEKNNKKGFFKDSFLFGDILFLIIPGIALAFSLIKWYFLFKPCIKCFLGNIV